MSFVVAFTSSVLGNSGFFSKHLKIALYWWVKSQILWHSVIAGSESMKG